MYTYSGSEALSGISHIIAKTPPEPLPVGNYPGVVVSAAFLTSGNTFVLLASVELSSPGFWDGSIITVSSLPALEIADMSDFLIQIGNSIGSPELYRMENCQDVSDDVVGKRTTLSVLKPNHPAHCDDISLGPIEFVPLG